MIKKCIWCGKVFETNTAVKRCPECVKLRKKVEPKVLSIFEIMYIAAIYDFINKTHIGNSYGEMVRIIKSMSPGACVCCGKPIKSQFPVCQECEKSYSKIGVKYE